MNSRGERGERSEEDRADKGERVKRIEEKRRDTRNRRGADVIDPKSVIELIPVARGGLSPASVEYTCLRLHRRPFGAATEASRGCANIGIRGVPTISQTWRLKLETLKLDTRFHGPLMILTLSLVFIVS